MDDRWLPQFLATFAPLSLMAFGGGQAIVGELQNQSVAVHGWLSAGQFADLFAISRAAPGPSTLIVALIGWQVAGFVGAAVATLAIFLPSSLLVYGLGTWWVRHRDSPVAQAVERGLTPVGIGLVFAGALAVLGSLDADFLQFATVVGTLLAMSFTKTGAYRILFVVALVHIAASRI